MFNMSGDEEGWKALTFVWVKPKADDKETAAKICEGNNEMFV